MKRFLIIYAFIFSMIWIGYGIFTVITNKPSANIILGIGVAFSIVLFATSWLSYWLISHYKNIDKLTKKIVSKR